jgi:2-alkyl-3-oxoalkanoate reductase
MPSVSQGPYHLVSGVNRRKETTMRLFVVGASGAVGKRLVPLLVEAGHDVAATTRTPEKAEGLRSAGAEPVLLDVLDPIATGEAVARAQPDVIVHQATALASMGGNPRKFDEDFALTNRLRTEGTDNLLAAARAAGTARLVAQSYTGWPYARVGGAVKTENDPLDPTPPKEARASLAAIRHLETRVTRADALAGLVLRYGGLYGPGTSLQEGGVHVEAIRKRKLPVVGGGTGVWSFVHVDDVATATLAAVVRGEPGIYNVVDDEPAPVSEWLPYLAEAIGAKPPRRVPGWIGRLVLGEFGLELMTTARGASNAKAKRELGWTLRYPSWRQGFLTGLGTA